MDLKTLGDTKTKVTKEMAVFLKKKGKVHKSITTKLWQLNEFIWNSIWLHRAFNEDGGKGSFVSRN
jgi:hypothetical protein